MTAAPRAVSKIVRGTKQMEGAGVRICRTIGTGHLRNLDPFLMLDELKMPAHEASAGFPDHPHRGFETCSIMLSGKMEHRDSYGNHGVIGPGGVQWMTAGRGIVHSEMPKVTEGMLHGFQLWINLPAKDKMVKPRYQDVQADAIPAVEGPGHSVRVMAGSVGATAGPLTLRNPGLLLDVRLEPGAEWSTEVTPDWNGFSYVYEGAGRIGGSPAAVENLQVFGNEGSTVIARAAEDRPLKFLLAFGKPIGEKVIQYGPFVMNHELEIQQAFADYHSGRLQNPNDDVWAAEQ
ncbi:hypothetical protein ACKKBG_A19830 [Auxenochlorella protothecoides x Auxenochlorella symbiontica]|uniref:Pirin-like protein n=1 Tax=Auxenochlorella protothecoides TaxID=3075 RepID=A0A087SJY3_AUXPR|nr:Pirin-like protein [Auxenochlorella protothecoides]KFM26037.1 Pirin-like protein [Auxenochlorella protothecoides]RMZ56758.1 hypothetical protein APUTEX25_002847 [Auxenochlorella protothecoides]|eukprot:RMZ56758.1 hypothetical protein APUTEX25_002847 [Auxenochlorella protothecoides]